MFSSSFDLFLIVQAGGTFRFCQILIPILLALAVIRIGGRRITATLGLLPLTVWLLFMVLFIPVADFWLKSLAYCLWLALNLALMFSFVQLFGDSLLNIRALIRWYAYSFGVIAAFGILQLCLSLLGYESPFITQWWITGQLPRVNGFSYEPSYFATYLLIGFVFVRALKNAGSRVLSSKSLVALSWLTGIGILLSSSRMGILFFCADLVLYQMRPWTSFLKAAARRRVPYDTIRALLPSALLMAAIGGSITLVGVWIRSNPLVLLMFLNGTGISDTAAHSVIQREDAFSETLAVFVNHPLIGQSLGGVSGAIAAMHGATVQSFEDSKPFEGMSIFAEALAASGVIGVLPFIWFLIVTVRSPLRAAAVALEPYASLLRALVRSTLFTWAILQFNQNILRPYVWVHLAVLATVYACAVRFSNASTSAVSAIKSHTCR